MCVASLISAPPVRLCDCLFETVPPAALSQAIAFAGGNLTAALLGVGPKISPPALAAAKSLASCMFQISTAPICTMKRHWAARVARDIVQGSEDGRVGFDAHLEAAMKEMSRSPLVLLSALWGLRASERSATLAMRIAEVSEPRVKLVKSSATRERVRGQGARTSVAETRDGKKRTRFL